MPETLTLESAGLQREALVFAPESQALAPLVLAFHGKGGSMDGAAKSFNLHTVWPEAVVAYPQGLATTNRLDPEGKRSGWQPKPGDLEDRDLLFVDALIDRLSTEYSVDRKRIYAMGHSNGGRFTYLLWAARSDVFAAYAPSANSIGVLAKMCKPKPVFIVAGEKDRVVPYESQKKAFDTIRGILGSRTEEAIENDLLRTEPGEAELNLYVHPGGHDYRKAATPLMVDFFKRHSL